jgi:hypothetical protein
MFIINNMFEHVVLTFKQIFFAADSSHRFGFDSAESACKPVFNVDLFEFFFVCSRTYFKSLGVAFI